MEARIKYKILVEARIKWVSIISWATECGKLGSGGAEEEMRNGSPPFLRPNIEINDYLHFFMELGLQPFDHPTFHPFYHEIVEVEQAEDSNAPIELLEVLWPGLLFGHLLFSRAGVKVRGGASFIKKETAEHSPIYFTYVRCHRETCDLSHGWGHNSQWRTRFRRDYTGDSLLYYHVDGEYDLSLPDRIVDKEEQEKTQPLSRAERIELLVNRCMIFTKKEAYVSEYWPYDDTYIEQKT